ncbi:MAG TPA: tetratricopeptide repeat protein [Polyangia bacterium]|nr:tetratricopeptide repeat protein [Polyangia bacterium]
MAGPAVGSPGAGKSASPAKTLMWTGGLVPGVAVKPGVPSAARPWRPGTPATDKSVSPGAAASPLGSGVARGDAKPATYAAASAAAATKRRVETAEFAVAPTMVPPPPGSEDAPARFPEEPAADAGGPAPGAVDVDISFESSVAPAGGAAAVAPSAAEPTREADAAPMPENGPSPERANDQGQKKAEGAAASEAVPEWAGSAPSVATVARLKGTRRKLYLAAGGVGVVVLAAVGVVVFAVGGKRQAGSDQKPAPVRAVLESDKAAALTPPAAVEKPALPAAAVEPAKPQPAAAEKPQPAAERKPAAAEKVVAPVEKPAQPEKAALAPSPAAEKPRPVEKKVTAEKPAPAERHVSAKPEASPKPAVEKPVAEKVRAPSEPAPPPGKKQAEAPAPVAQPAINRTQEAAEAYQRGNAKLLNGALPEAIAAFSQALKLNPKDAQSQRGLGRAYAQSGNAAQAVRHFKLYLKALPSAPDRALIEKRIAQLGGR